MLPRSKMAVRIRQAPPARKRTTQEGPEIESHIPKRIAAVDLTVLYLSSLVWRPKEGTEGTL